MRQAIPFAETDYQVNILFNTIASFFNEKGEIDKAITFAREGIELDRRTLSPDNCLLASDLMFLAMMFEKKGEMQEAVEVAEEGVDIFRKAMGDSNPSEVEKQQWLLQRMKNKLEREKGSGAFFDL